MQYERNKSFVRFEARPMVGKITLILRVKDLKLQGKRLKFLL
jgi:hypothetical protein